MHASIRIPLSIVAVLTLSQLACKQPDLDCTSAHGTFAAHFELKKGDKDSPCGGLTTDILGMQTYYAEGGVNGTPKFSESTVAIRAQYLYAYVYDRVLGDLFADDEELSMFEELEKLNEMVGDPDSLGDFAGVPDGEGFCSAPKMSKVSLELPEIAEIPAVEDDPSTPDADESDPGAPGQPAANLTYVWEDVRFLVTPDAQGTQFEANLKFTQDGCQAEYLVKAVYPATPCEAPEDCHAEGSSLNPDFKLKCVDNLCVIDGDLPAYE